MVYSPVPPATAPHTGDAEHGHPGALGAVHPGRLRRGRRWPPPTGAREHRASTSPRCSAPTRPRPSSWPPTRTRSRTPETADYVGVAVHCAQGSAFCATAKGVKFGQTTPVADRGARPAAGRAGRVQRLPGAVRPPVRRAAARRGHAEPDPQRLPGHQRGRQPGRPERQPDQRRVPDQPPGLPRLRPHQRLADAGLHGRHAGVRRPRGQRLHRRHPRQRAHSRPDRVRRRARARWAAAPPATSPRRSTTTPRSAPSSSAWPPTASPRPTRCSSSAPTRATTRPAPTSAGPSSPRRPTATA